MSDATKKQTPIFLWTSIWLFPVSFGVYAIVYNLQVPGGGDSRMAAAINAGLISTGIMLLGFISAVVGLVKERQHRIPWTISLVLYLVIPAAFGLYVLFE